MQTLNWRRALLWAAVPFVVVALLGRLLLVHGATPWRIPWTTAIVCLVLAGVVLWAANLVRLYQAGKRPLDLLLAARIALFSQAAIYAGLSLAGVFAGYAVALLLDLGPGPRKEILVLAIITSAAAGFLSVAGWLGERWCRISDDDDDNVSGSGSAVAN